MHTINTASINIIQSQFGSNMTDSPSYSFLLTTHRFYYTLQNPLSPYLLTKNLRTFLRFCLYGCYIKIKTIPIYFYIGIASGFMLPQLFCFVMSSCFFFSGCHNDCPFPAFSVRIILRLFYNLLFLKPAPCIQPYPPALLLQAERFFAFRTQPLKA